MAASNVLLVGCEGVGKTVLSRRLRAVATGKPLQRGQLETTSTTGQELESFSPLDSSSTITLREVGSPMIPLWASYVEACSQLLFVVDLSQPGLVAASFVELCALLALDGMRSTRCIVVLNKLDALTRLSVAEACALLHLEELAESSKASGIDVQCVAVSALTGDGAEELLRLLQA